MQNQRTTTHKNSAIEDISFVEVRPTSPLVTRANEIIERAKPAKVVHPIAAKIGAMVPKINPDAIKQVAWALAVAVASFCFWGLVLCFWAVIKLLTFAWNGCKALTVGGGGHSEEAEVAQESKSNVNVSVNVEVKINN